MKNIKKRIKIILLSFVNTVKVPNVIVLVFMGLFLAVDIFASFYAGINLAMNAIVLILIMGLIPFIIGGKTESKSLTPVDYMLSLILIIIVFILSVQVKNSLIGYIYFPDWIFYITLVVVVIWYLLDFKEYYNNYKRHRMAVDTNPNINTDGEGNRV